MKARTKSDALIQNGFRNRSRMALTILLTLAIVLVVRAVWLQTFDDEFLTRQGDVRQLRVAKIPSHRGVISDRNGEPLAVSTPVDSIWVNPREIVRAPDRIPQLAAALGVDTDDLAQRLTRSIDREFMYLKRHMRPAAAAAIAQLAIPGIDVEREYQRYYPAGEVIGHLVGFTNIDDTGQEGLELAFDQWLAGQPGKRRVLKDRLGRIVEDVERIQSPTPGRELTTSIDLRIQYLAYRELKAAIQRNGAASGSVVVLDVETGEVLAMVNQPSYNPNDRSQFSPTRYRNRAITDIFEPGSTMKTLIVAAALESGKYNADSRINTAPGRIKVGAKLIEDDQNLGRIDFKTLLARSSNVGATKVAMSIPPETLYGVLSGFGLGKLSGSGFPGESAGLLSHHSNWRPISQATLAYGYGLSVTPLQLAQAYSIIASGGLQRPVSLLRIEQPPIARRVIKAETAQSVLAMLEAVVGTEGSGQKANVAGYRVAGKTGTVKKFAPGGYAENRYMAVFSGIAPATRPRLAVVVMIDDPSNGEYYGGAVAAPVFSSVVEGALRILAIPPDNLIRPSKPTLAASKP